MGFKQQLNPKSGIQCDVIDGTGGNLLRAKTA